MTSAERTRKRRIQGLRDESRGLYWQHVRLRLGFSVKSCGRAGCPIAACFVRECGVVPFGTRRVSRRKRIGGLSAEGSRLIGACAVSIHGCSGLGHRTRELGARELGGRSRSGGLKQEIRRSGDTKFITRDLLISCSDPSNEQRNATSVSSVDLVRYPPTRTPARGRVV